MSVSFWLIIPGWLSLWPWALLLPTYLFAQLRGDATTRACAGVLGVAALLGTLLAERSSPEPVSFGLDLLLLIALFAIVLRNAKLYPIWIAAAQLLAVLIEAISLAGLGGAEATLRILLPACSVVQLCAFAYGLIAHRSRRPLWQVKPRRENAASDLAPRAKGAR